MRRSKLLVIVWVLSLVGVTVLILAVFNGDRWAPDTGVIDEISAEGALAMSSDDSTTPRPHISTPGSETEHRIVWAPTFVSQLTGAGSPARTDELWNIAGTDLGSRMALHRLAPELRREATERRLLRIALLLGIW